MSIEANFSLKEQYAYYGLRATPLYSDMVKSFDKPKTTIRVPKDRAAKYYALGPYRAYLMDAQRKFHNFEAQKLAYRESLNELPESATFGTLPSEGAYDPNWQETERQHEEFMDNLADLTEEAQDKIELLKQEKFAREMHFKNMIQKGSLDPTVEQHSEGLQEAGVPHVVAAPSEIAAESGGGASSSSRIGPPRLAAEGIPAPPTFRPIEELNNVDFDDLNLGRTLFKQAGRQRKYVKKSYRHAVEARLESYGVRRRLPQYLYDEDMEAINDYFDTVEKRNTMEGQRARWAQLNTE